MFDPERTGRFIRFLTCAQKEIDHMNAPLPPFNLVSRCPKCGMEGGGLPSFEGRRPYRTLPTFYPPVPDPFPVEYHAGGALPFGRFPCSLELHVEHLHRTCPRCGFAWAEACPQFPDNPITAVVSHVRPEVAAFALLMERELAKHDDHPGWKTWGKDALLGGLREMVSKLAVCLDENPAYLGHRAADAANFCMFIADVGGALDPASKEEK